MLDWSMMRTFYGFGRRSRLKREKTQDPSTGPAVQEAEVGGKVVTPLKAEWQAFFIICRRRLYVSG
jgi:hypothetical protein